MRVKSTVPNQSTLCSGVRFFPVQEGYMVSDDIQDPDVVNRFLAIPGYTPHELPTRADVEGKKANKAKKDEKEQTNDEGTASGEGGGLDKDLTGNPDGENGAEPDKGHGDEGEEESGDGEGDEETGDGEEGEGAAEEPQADPNAPPPGKPKPKNKNKRRNRARK